MITRQKINDYWRKYASMANAMDESPEPYDRANAMLARLAAGMWRAASVGQIEESDWRDNPAIKSYDISMSFDPRGPLETFRTAWAKYCKSGIAVNEPALAVDRFSQLLNIDPKVRESLPRPKGNADFKLPPEIRDKIHEAAAQAIILEYEAEFGLDRLDDWAPPPPVNELVADGTSEPDSSIPAAISPTESVQAESVPPPTKAKRSGGSA